MVEAVQGETGPADRDSFTDDERSRFNVIANRLGSPWSVFARITLKLSGKRAKYIASAASFRGSLGRFSAR